MLIIKKLNKGLQIYIDYRALNALIIKNRNAPPLIRKTLSQLYLARIYTKFDVIITFNEIRIREGDEEKIIFLIRYRLFKYIIILFRLYNAPRTFQSFINNTLREYSDIFYTAYLNDILIYNNTEEEHIIHIKKVLEKL